MREIKFRAWHKETKKMIDLKKITPLALRDNIDGIFLPFKDGIILVQFTGLLDKNGKEIYEGDIVRYNKTNEKTTTTVAEVFWNTLGMGGWWLVDLPDRYHSGGMHIDSIEVIGNIHENPELLNG